MLENFNNFLIVDTPASYLVRVLVIIVATFLAARLSSWLVTRALLARSLSWRKQHREKRLITLQSLVGSFVRIFVYVLGFIIILLVLGIPAGSIITALGLFSAGFGFGARPIISDYVTGLVFIFEDQYSVGDKVEMLEIVGVVEAVDMRVTHLRSNTGELYIVPNGDVRVVRNLSRGLFSMATIKVTVATEDISKALQVLEDVANTAQEKLKDLVERPEFLSEEGVISNHVELTLLAKATYGRGARVRTRLMAMVTDTLKAADVRIIS